MAYPPVPRDIYVKGVDFTSLALQYPDFAKRLKRNRQLDFSDPESVRQLTKALLQRDFKLSVDLPDNRLCPPVPNRFNYVLWMQDLLNSTSDDFREKYDPTREVVGLDIGTGASAIYPLLACQQHANWKFLATETDAISEEYALRNIVSNGLENRIKLVPVMGDGPLLPQALRSIDNIDFVMTNPPFYASEEEMLESAKKKQRPPFSACTGAPMEIITPGGEVTFVSKLIEESIKPQSRDKIQWFTSMLGKLTSVSTLVQALRDKGCSNYAVTEFIQGQKTRRWAIAWSWQGLRPSTSVTRGIPGFEKKLLPFPSDFDFDLVGYDLDAVGRQIEEQLQALDLQFRYKTALAAGVGMAGRDVWSRKARRRKTEDENGDHEMSSHNGEAEDPALAFKISLTKQTAPDSSVRTKIRVRWLQGRDAVIFESFCGWLKRKMQNS